MKNFPLPGLLRQVSEGHLEQAAEMLELAEEDIRRLLVGDERSGVFKESTDPVDVLIGAAKQFELCRVVIQFDDEARKEGE